MFGARSAPREPAHNTPTPTAGVGEGGAVPNSVDSARETPSPLHIRVQSSNGVFLLYGAGAKARDTRGRSAYLALWRGFNDAQPYVFGRRVKGLADVGHALLGLERDFGVDAVEIAAPHPQFVAGLEIALGMNEDDTPWLTPTRNVVLGLMGLRHRPTPDGNDPMILAATAPCEFPSAATAPQDQASEPMTEPGGDKGSHGHPTGGVELVPAMQFEGPGKREIDRVADEIARGLLDCEPVDDGGDSGGGGSAGGRDMSEACAATMDTVPDALADMEENLEPTVDAEGWTTVAQIGEPVPNEWGTSATAPVQVADDTGVVRTGSVAVVPCTDSGRAVSLYVSMDDGDADAGIDPTRAWMLSQRVRMEDQTVRFWGSVRVDDLVEGTTMTLDGGWTYSALEGPQIDPNSDPEFHDHVADMFNLPDGGIPEGGAATARGNLGTLLAWIGNLFKLPVNYILDLFIPYSAPTSCSGPYIYGNCSGSVPCRDRLADLCESIHDLPNVSTAFKKCMKGRCACGGSTFRRLRVTCASSTDCGPCGHAAGCNSWGERIWYCLPSGSGCPCAATVFHEMAHACGAPDDRQRTCAPWNPCPPGNWRDSSGACYIGFWFQDQCCLEGP